MVVDKFTVDLVVPVYNAGLDLMALLENLKSWVNRWPELRVILVDDGSEDCTKGILGSVKTPRVSIVYHAYNQGRAAALNTGWKCGCSSFVGFLDVDCIPQENWLDDFISAINFGKTAIFGNLKAKGDSYWSIYLNELYEKRGLGYLAGSRDFSTPFCVFSRDLLERAGGLCNEYRKYGFEDRDLVQNMLKEEIFNPIFLPKTYAIHSPPEVFESVENKTFQSGESTAKIFSGRFPIAYRNTVYWYLDVREHGVLYAALLSALFSILSAKRSFLVGQINKQKVPFVLWRFLVKLMTARAYFLGTASRPLY